MPSVLDDFTRANETPLAGNWTAFNGGSIPRRFNLVSNACVANNTTTDDECAYWNANTFGPDQFAQAALTLSGTAGGAQGLGLLLRTDGAGASGAPIWSGYRLVVDHAASTNVDFTRVNAGTFNHLATATQSWTDTDTWRFEVSGYLLKAYRNGALVLSYDDSASGSKIASGRCGITSSSAYTSGSLDNWAAGDLGLPELNQAPMR